ncbi:MAG TPA: glycosyltransferase family 1 protein [Paludibacter sp.]
MKKILIDGRLLSDKPTGISRYSKEVIQALIEHYGGDNIVVLVDAKYPNINNYNVLYTRLKPYNPIHYLLFSIFIYRQEFSIYYSTFYSGIFFKAREKKQILTVHDLMYLRIANYFSISTFRNSLNKFLLNCIVKSGLRSSNLVISVSKTTKKDLLEYFNTDSVVIGEGVNYLNEKASVTIDVFERLKIQKEKYFLYVGNFRRQKNISFLLDAFNFSHTTYQLVLVGENSFPKHKNEKVIFAGILEDFEIRYLYKNCLAFVMPSLYEGFGLPILEAYSAGARVLSSNQGALAEFNDLGIHYFSPFNINELVALLQNIENLPKPTESEIDSARKVYSWKNQTDQIIDSIESLNNK